MTATTLLVVPRSIPMILGMSHLLMHSSPGTDLRAKGPGWNGAGARRTEARQLAARGQWQSPCHLRTGGPAATLGISTSYAAGKLPNQVPRDRANAKSTVTRPPLPERQTGSGAAPPL